MLQVSQVFGQIARLQVVEDERDLATVFDAGIADRDIADPVVGRQTTKIDERSQFEVAGPFVGCQPTLPIFDESRQLGVQVKVNRELSNPKADGIANGATKFVDLTRRQPVVLALATGRAITLGGFGGNVGYHRGWTLLRCAAQFVNRLTGHVIRGHCTKFAVVIAKIVVVVGADASRSRDQNRIGAAVCRPQK